MRSPTILSATLALAALSCTSERAPTEPSDDPSLRRAAGIHTAGTPTVAVHPSKKLDPDGRTVTVIGKRFPANVTVQLAECTGTPLVCQVLRFVNTNKRGMFVSRVLVAFDLTVINPFPPVPTCSVPTFTGNECLLIASVTTAPFASAFEPLEFSR